MKPLAKPGQTWHWGADLHPKWLNAFLRARKSLQNIPPTSQCHHLSKEPVVVQSFSPFQLFETPWTAPRQPSRSFTISRNLLKLMPLSRGCHPTISSSVTPFSSCPQSFLASWSFPMSQLFTSGDQSIRASASKSVLLMNIQGWFP